MEYPSNSTEEISEEISEIQLDTKWKQRRRKSLAIYTLNEFVIGIQDVMLRGTLLPYLTNEIGATHTAFFYGIICASRYMAPLFLGTFISRWFDKHRKITVAVNVLNAITIVGHVVYMIPLSPWFPFVGGVLQAAPYFSRMFMYSEILRVYESDEIQEKLLYLFIGLGFGLTLGAILLLVKVDFWIWAIHFSYGNTPSLMIIGVGAVTVILCYFFLHDVSKEFDLKAHRSRVEHTEASERTDETPSTKSLPPLRRLRAALGPDVVLLLIQQFYTCLTQSLLLAMLPPIIESLSYNTVIASLAYMSVSVFLMIISFVISKMNLSSVGIYNSGVLSLVVLLLDYVIILLFRRGFGNPVNYTLTFMFTAFYTYSWLADQTYIVATLGKLFSSSNQTFIESIRLIVWMIGSVCGMFFSMYAYNNFIYMFPALILATVLLLVGMALRRDTLRHPKIAKTEWTRLD